MYTLNNSSFGCAYMGHYLLGYFYAVISVCCPLTVFSFLVLIKQESLGEHWFGNSIDWKLHFANTCLWTGFYRSSSLKSVYPAVLKHIQEQNQSKSEEVHQVQVLNWSCLSSSSCYFLWFQAVSWQIWVPSLQIWWNLRESGTLLWVTVDLIQPRPWDTNWSDAWKCYWFHHAPGAAPCSAFSCPAALGMSGTQNQNEHHQTRLFNLPSQD